jgi:hypothetical protein
MAEEYREIDEVGRRSFLDMKGIEKHSLFHHGFSLRTDQLYHIYCDSQHWFIRQVYEDRNVCLSKHGSVKGVLLNLTCWDVLEHFGVYG